MKKLGLAIVAALMVVVAVLLVAHRKESRQSESPTSPATTSPNKLNITGVYSDDWLANCAPLSGAAQDSCTAALNAHYGKADAAPVPGANEPHAPAPQAH
ncbi:MAG: hypothetical protein M0006_08405 [Magnetospirillum sp.]|nr:hypothetical protein [Magnetospirillum sp.]